MFQHLKSQDSGNNFTMHLPKGANGPQEMFFKLNQALNC